MTKFYSIKLLKKRIPGLVKISILHIFFSILNIIQSFETKLSKGTKIYRFSISLILLLKTIFKLWFVD